MNPPGEPPQGKPHPLESEVISLRRQLEQSRKDIRTLRRVLAQVRPVLVTNHHKQLVDKTLVTFRDIFTSPNEN